MEGSPECASVSEPLRVTTTIKQPHPGGVRGSSALGNSPFSPRFRTRDERGLKPATTCGAIWVSIFWETYRPMGEGLVAFTIGARNADTVPASETDSAPLK